jgi:hypothetical protein
VYDLFFPILYNIWRDDVNKRSAQLQMFSPEMQALISRFEKVHDETGTFEQARDMVFHGRTAADFPYGRNNASVDKIAECMLPIIASGWAYTSCPKYRFCLSGFSDTFPYHTVVIPSNEVRSNSDAVVTLQE